MCFGSQYTYDGCAVVEIAFDTHAHSFDGVCDFPLPIMTQNAPQRLWLPFFNRCAPWASGWGQRLLHFVAFAGLGTRLRLSGPTAAFATARGFIVLLLRAL